jgi:glycine hydroxymethyltransferase
MFKKDTRLLNKVLMTGSFPMRAKSAITRELPIQDLSLDELDPELTEMIYNEQKRQFRGIELIASENFAYRHTMQMVGSSFLNDDSQRNPAGWYGGERKLPSEVERLCEERALKCFRLDPKKWSVNTQLQSGSPANFAVYCALLSPGDKLMGLDLSQGGHLTHGF